MDRYSRQMRFGPIGEEGQKKLLDSRVTVIGAGALGSVLASLAARSGVGHLQIVDRDVVEIHNLQRQFLYDETDVREARPKAVAAAQRLSLVNSEIEVTGVVADVGPTNIEDLVEGSDLILDGTDNFLIRFLINDIALDLKIPWVYTGVVAAYGQVLAIVPHQSPCLRCYIPTAPAPGEVETCETAGVLGPAVATLSSLAFTQGVQLLLGKLDRPALHIVDVWKPSMGTLNLSRDPECPACERGEREYLRHHYGQVGEATVLCGSDAVQIRSHPVDLSQLSKKLQSLGAVKANSHLLKFSTEDKSLTVFADGRVIVTGTSEPAQARSFLARYVGQ